MRWGTLGAGPMLFTAIGMVAAQPPPATPPPTSLPPSLEVKSDTPPAAEPIPAPAAMTPVADCAPPRWVDTHRGPAESAWLSASYKLMWLKDGPQQFPLATIGPNIVVGGSDIDFGTFNAGQVNGGLWINRCHTVGVYLGGFLTEQRSVASSAISDGTGAPGISRPFIDALTVMPSALLVSSPGVFAGSIVADADARFAGAEAGTLWNLAESDSCSINLLSGFRYLDLDENLSIAQSTNRIGVPITGLPPPPLGIEDRFHTRNSFLGGQIGICAEYRYGSLVAGIASKVSLGTNHEAVEIIGKTTGLNSAPGDVSGGFLALPGGNAGRDVNNRFVVVPEIGATLGWQVNRWLRLNVGYDFLYINDVVRPGSQIDPFLNQKLIPVSTSYGSTSGPNFPMRSTRSDSFYAQSVQFGVVVKY
jgi:Putative beta barrel porin-7 (BBP7)